MASPQCGDGYTMIANELLDFLCKIRVSGEENQVLLTIFRKTYGFKKKSDLISLSQFEQSTGIKKPNIVRAISKLLSKKIISVIKKDNGISEYSVCKDYETWQPLSKKITLSKKIKSVIKKDNASLSKKIHTKETTTKEKRNKHIVELSPDEIKLCDYFRKETGRNFSDATIMSFAAARIKEGIDPKRLAAVIYIKNREWKDDEDMRKYLRPETLFNKTKCHSYMAEVDDYLAKREARNGF